MGVLNNGVFKFFQKLENGGRNSRYHYSLAIRTDISDLRETTGLM